MNDVQEVTSEFLDVFVCAKYYLGIWAKEQKMGSLLFDL